MALYRYGGIVSGELTKAEKLNPIVFTPSDRQRAEELKDEIDKTVVWIAGGYTAVHQGFVRLGALVLEVEKKRFWYLWGSTSYHNYILDLGKKILKGQTQIYHSVSVARYLLPHVSQDDLEKMGITNASALARVVRITGKVPSDNIVRAGREMTLQEYRAALAKEFKIIDTKPGERWRELGGFWCSDEEWETIQQAFRILKMQMIESGEITNESHEQYCLKITILHMAEEIIGTYSQRGI
jgi:hypothetical protein